MTNASCNGHNFIGTGGFVDQNQSNSAPRYYSNSNNNRGAPQEFLSGRGSGRGNNSVGRGKGRGKGKGRGGYSVESSRESSDNNSNSEVCLYSDIYKYHNDDKQKEAEDVLVKYKRVVRNNMNTKPKNTPFDMVVCQFIKCTPFLQDCVPFLQEFIGLYYVFTPITLIELKKAVNDWFENRHRAYSLYGHISRWNISHITSTQYLFSNRSTFNEDLSRWDMSNVTFAYKMFRGCTSYDRSLATWTLNGDIDATDIFEGCLLNENQDWDTQELEDMIQKFSLTSGVISLYRSLNLESNQDLANELEIKVSSYMERRERAKYCKMVTRLTI